jgi:NhaA family Na+:H+ antiporter
VVRKIQPIIFQRFFRIEKLGASVLLLFEIAALVMACPSPVGWTSLLDYACLAGISFTLSLFIAMLAFDSTASIDAAEQGILAGSVLAGVAGAIILRAARHYRDEQ